MAATALTSRSVTTAQLASSALSSAGDVNGDGYADIIAGNIVFQGSSTGLSSARSITLTNPDNAGGTAAGVGDINGDGYADVATGADGVLDCLGRVYIYLGSAAGFTATQQPIILTGPDVDDEFGISIANRIGPETSVSRPRSNRLDPLSLLSRRNG